MTFKRNFVYAIVSTSPSPTGQGTILGWLKYYKLHNEGSNYVFLDPAVDGVPEVGDTLWFQVDDKIIARVPLSQVLLDPMSDRFELWYEGKDIIHINGIQTQGTGHRFVGLETASTWESYVGSLIHSAGTP
jgi:hypothetical protein